MHSQRWMFTSPGGENEYKRLSTTREHYDVIDAKEKKETVETETDRKRRLFENSLWKKITDSALDKIKKLQQADSTRTVRSTYAETFVKEGFQVKELGTEIDEKLQQKYPLYTDSAKSFHLREIHKTKAKEPVHRSPAVIFRKDSRFTERLSNPLDIHSPVGPGHFAYV